MGSLFPLVICNKIAFEEEPIINTMGEAMILLLFSSWVTYIVL